MSQPRMPDCPTCGDNQAVHDEGNCYYFCTFCSHGFEDESNGPGIEFEPTFKIADNQIVGDIPPGGGA